jgi:hypothetical protein
VDADDRLRLDYEQTALEVPEAQATGAAIGGVAGVIVLFEVERAGWRAAAAR